VAAPAARSVLYGGSDAGLGSRASRLSCIGYDTEAQSPVGRLWVRELYRAGYACELDDDTILSNLERLPEQDPVFIVSDGERRLPMGSAGSIGSAASALGTRFVSLDDVMPAGVSSIQYRAIELAVCASGDTLLLNEYSPLSHMLWRRMQGLPRPGAGDGGAKPRSLGWLRIDSDSCLPLFTRTARFIIQPNRFGILGQFGPERKLQLVSKNLSSLVGPDGLLMPNASLEMELYLSNASHPLLTFEYTRENNDRGIILTVPKPRGGWTAHEWHFVSLRISSEHHASPSATPWENMDRLELYYANPSNRQRPGSYVRIRNVYIRSSRSFRGLAHPHLARTSNASASRRCRDLDLTGSSLK
jgi:hypothetical protein